MRDGRDPATVVHTLPAMLRFRMFAIVRIRWRRRRAHGHQQQSLFHVHYDTRCFLLVHVNHVESGNQVWCE